MKTGQFYLLLTSLIMRLDDRTTQQINGIILIIPVPERKLSMPKIFISYSHDSDEHRDFVRAISDRMRGEGLDCQIDQYINGFPPEGWQHWMEKQIELADFVLLVCTPNYLKRYRGAGKRTWRDLRKYGHFTNAIRSFLP